MRKSFALGLVAVTVATLTACSTYAPPDGIYLYYTAGVNETKKFHSCIEPSQKGDYPVDDEIFLLPTSVQTWSVRADGGGDTKDPIRSGTLPVTVTRDGVASTTPGPEIGVYTSSEFFINSDCKDRENSPIVKFWETKGRNAGVSADGEDRFSEENFRNLLLQTLVTAQEKVVHEETRKFDADTLDGNLGGAWAQIERSLAVTFPTELKDKLGGDFFCGVGYARGKETSWKEWVNDGTDQAGKPKYKEIERRGTCPPVRISITDVNFADPAVAAARTRVFTESQNAEADRIKANSEAVKAKTLGEAAKTPGYLEMQRVEKLAEVQKQAAEACKSNPNCVLVLDQTGNANVHVGK